jgi:methyl-accepting chemotaxis protein
LQEIAAASTEQNTGASQINMTIQQLNGVTQSNSSTSEELASSAEELATQAESLQEMVSFFKIEKGSENKNAKSVKKEKYPQGKKIETQGQNIKKQSRDITGEHIEAYPLKSNNDKVHIELEEFEKF